MKRNQRFCMQDLWKLVKKQTHYISTYQGIGQILKKKTIGYQFRSLSPVSSDQLPCADKETEQRIKVKPFEMKNECMLLPWKTIIGV